MSKRKQVTFQGKKVWGQTVSFTGSEEWNTYNLEDGSRLRVKSVVAEIVRLEEFREDGEPIYAFTTKQISSTEVPEELMKERVEKLGPSLTQ